MRTPIHAPDSLPKPEFLTAREAATWLRLSPRTLEHMRMTGDGPAYVKAGGGRNARVLYRQSDLDAWIASRVVTSTAEAAANSQR